MTKRKLKEGGRAWEAKARRLAYSYAPHIYACKKCGDPVASGYCCTYCGAGSPNTTPEEDAEFERKYGK